MVLLLLEQRRRKENTGSIQFWKQDKRARRVTPAEKGAAGLKLPQGVFHDVSGAGTTHKKKEVHQFPWASWSWTMAGKHPSSHQERATKKQSTDTVCHDESFWISVWKWLTQHVAPIFFHISYEKKNTCAKSLKMYKSICDFGVNCQNVKMWPVQLRTFLYDTLAKVLLSRKSWQALYILFTENWLVSSIMSWPSLAASWYIMSASLYWSGYRGLLSYLGGADVFVELHQLLYPPLQLGQTQIQPAPSAAQLRSLF